MCYDAGPRAGLAGCQVLQAPDVLRSEGAVYGTWVDIKATCTEDEGV